MATKKYLSLERLSEYDELIKGEIAEGVETAKGHTNTEITKLTNGTTVVAKATNAVNAENAVSATNATTAGSAAKLTNSMTITLSGDASGSVSFDGSQNVTLSVAVADDSHNHVISNIDGLQTALEGKETKGAAAEALSEANKYTDEKVANLLNNSTEAVDSIMELAAAMEDNAEAIDALREIAGSKVSTNTKINGKALTGDITLSASDVGADASGSASAVQGNLDTHTGNTTVHITATERTNWNAAKSHADAAHAPSNAEKNQNAFSNVKVGSVTVAADNATDTIEIAAGTGITVSGDATNDKVTITNSGVIAVTTGSANGTISVNTNGTAADVAVKGLGSAAYTNSSAYAEAGHKHVTGDITGLDQALLDVAQGISANAGSINAHKDRLDALEGKVGDGFAEITSAEIQALFSK